MRKDMLKRVLAFVLTFAMVVCDAGLSNLVYAAEEETEVVTVESLASDEEDAEAETDDEATTYLKNLLTEAWKNGCSSVDVDTDTCAVTYDEVCEVYEDLLLYDYTYFYVDDTPQAAVTSEGIVTKIYITYGLADGYYGTIIETDDEGESHIGNQTDLKSDQLGEIADMQAELAAVVAEVVAGADLENWTDAEKVLYLNDYLAENCQYDQESYDLSATETITDRLIFTAYGALVENLCVCEGYSRAFVVLATLLGLEAETVSSSTIGHQWNAVKVDGEWYMVDVTWDDPIKSAYTTAEDEDPVFDTIGRVSHTYLLRGLEYFQTAQGNDQAHTPNEDGTYTYTGGLTDDDIVRCESDASYFWDDVDVPFVYDAGNQVWYALVAPTYVEDESEESDGLSAEDIAGTIYAVKFTSNDAWPDYTLEELATVADIWTDQFSDDGSVYVTGMYCMQYYDGKLYYTTTDTVYAYDIESGESTYYYGLTDEQLTIGEIYGLRILDDGTMYIQLAPNFDYTGEIIKLLDVDEARASVGSSTVTVTLYEEGEEVTDETYTFDKTEKKPDVEVKDGDDDLYEGEDYRITYSDNSAAGTATVTVTGIGDYNGVKEVTFTINRANKSGEISDFSMSYGSYTASALTDGDGNVLTSGYDSEGILYIDEDGVISAVGVGTTTLYMYVGDIEGNENYAYTTATVTVNKAKQTISGVGNVSMSTSATTKLNPTSSIGDAATFSYVSSNTSVVTVDASGNLTPKGIGTATVTITAEETDYYKSASVEITVTVMGEQTLSITSPGTVYVGSTATIGATSTGNGTLSFTSSDTSIATVDSSTGVVTGVKVGTVTITVQAAASSTYTASAKYTVQLLVLPAATASVSLSNETGGVKVTWKKVTDASGYYVLRSTSSSGTYSAITQLTSGSTLTYTDAGASGGTTYYYKVVAYYTSGSNTYLGKESSVSNIKYLKQATVSSVKNDTSGVTVSWSSVSGAGGYYIYRGSTQVKKITSGSTLSWTDTTAASGTTYTYYVQAYSGSTKGSKSAGKSIKYLKRGTVSSLTNASSGVTVKWSKVSGADGYYIYRGSTAVKQITSGSTTSWTDTSVKSKSGTTYKYYVMPYSGSTYGAKSAAKSIKRLTQGKVSSLTNVSTGITVKWSKVTGASGYYIYRGSTQVKKITSGSTTSWTDTGVKSKNGTTYTYYVVPYSGSYKGAKSSGVKTVRLTAVTLSSVKNSASKAMTVTYKKNSKATGYEIQYSTSKKFSSGNKTVTVSSASTLSKKITKLTKGKTYYVRVRAYKTVSGTKYYSAYSSTKSVKISK